MSETKETLEKLDKLKSLLEAVQGISKDCEGMTEDRASKDRTVVQAQVIYEIANEADEASVLMTATWNAGSLKGAYLKATLGALQSEEQFKKHLKRFKDTCEKAYDSLESLYKEANE